MQPDTVDRLLEEVAALPTKKAVAVLAEKGRGASREDTMDIAAAIFRRFGLSVDVVDLAWLAEQDVFALAFEEQPQRMVAHGPLSVLQPLYDILLDGKAAEPAEGCVHLFAPTRPERAGRSVGRAALPVDWGDLDGPVDAELEREIGATFQEAARLLGSHDRALLAVPLWAVTEPGPLNTVREDLNTAGTLRRIVLCPARDRSRPRVALVLLGGTPVEEEAIVFVPAALPSVHAHQEIEVEWMRVRFSRAVGQGRQWAQGALISGNPDLRALMVLGTWTEGQVGLTNLETRRQDIDPNYLRAMLEQPPYQRLFSSSVPPSQIPLPLPAMGEQARLALVLMDRTADLRELALLFQGRDPDNRQQLGHASSFRRYLRLAERAVGRSQQASGWLRWSRKVLQGENLDVEMPLLEMMARWMSEKATVQDALRDAAQAPDSATRVARLSAAIAAVSEMGQEGRLFQLARGTVLRDLKRARARAIGTIELAFEVAGTEWDDGKLVVHLDAENISRVAIFDLHVRAQLPEVGCANLHFATLGAEKLGKMKITYGAVEPGSVVLNVSWRARDLVGDPVRGETVVPLEIPPASDTDAFDNIFTGGSWEALEEARERLDPSDLDAGILLALLAARSGDMVAARRVLSGCAEENPDTLKSEILATVAFMIGCDVLALQIAQAAAERSHDDEDVACLVGRLRLWAGAKGGRAPLMRAAMDDVLEARVLLAALEHARGAHTDAAELVRGLEEGSALEMLALRIARGEPIASVLEALEPEPDVMAMSWAIVDLVLIGALPEARAALPRLKSFNAVFAGLLGARVAARDGNEAERARWLEVAFGVVPPLEHLRPVAQLPPNPYVIGKPIRRAADFYGRRREVEQILDAVARGSEREVVLIEGPRRVGKTSILAFAQSSLPEDILPVPFSFQRLSGGAGAGELWAALGRRLGCAAKRSCPAERYDDLLDAVEQILVDGPWRGIVLFLDEYEALEDRIDAGAMDPAVVGKLRHLVQGRDVGMVLAGAHELAEQRRAYRSPLFGFAVRQRIGGLDEEDARELVVRPSRGHVRWEPAATSLVTELAGRQPFYIQHLCHAIYRARQERPRLARVGRQEVLDALEACTQAAEESLDYLYTSAPAPFGTAILRRLAREPLLSEDGIEVERLFYTISKALDGTVEKVADGLDALASRGLIERGRLANSVRITPGLLHYRIAQQWPWD